MIQTYSKFIKSFNTHEEFISALGQLSEEEIRTMISAGEHSHLAKACIVTVWKNAKERQAD